MDLIIKESNKTEGFASMVLSGFYDKGDQEIWHLIDELLKHGFESEVIKGITNFHFSNADNVAHAVKVGKMIDLPFGNKWQLVYWNTTLLNCEYSSAEIKQDARESLQALSKINDSQIRRNLIYELRFLKNYNQDKLIVVLNLDFTDKNIYSGLNFLIEDFEPMNYFQVLMEMIRQLKAEFDPNAIEFSLSSVAGKHPTEFSNELTKLMVHREGIVRFCACKLLQELNKDSPFTFSVDLLVLPERDQIRIIDTVLFDFIHPEKVIPYLLIFRASQSKKVLQFMTQSLLQLISDYSDKALDAIRESLYPQLEIDQKLLHFCEQAYQQLIDLIKTKHSLEEFKPHKNCAKAFNHFERLYRKNMSRQVGESHDDYMKNSPLFSMVYTVQIVRGKSWRIESKGGEPEELSEFSVGMSLPRTFLMNPDGYNYAMRVKIASNYTN